VAASSVVELEPERKGSCSVGVCMAPDTDCLDHIGLATNPSSDIVRCQSTLPPAVCRFVSAICVASMLCGVSRGPPGIVFGFGDVNQDAIRRGIAAIGDLLRQGYHVVAPVSADNVLQAGGPLRSVEHMFALCRAALQVG
jgi:hypothetical protein